MKTLFTLILSLCVYGASAQTTLYTQTFNGTYTDWSLNTSDLGGDVSLSDNQWVVNNIYAGTTSPICGITVPSTANEIAGITGYPNSNYLHIYSSTWVALCIGTANSNFDAGTPATYFAALNTPIVTTGYTGVSFSFYWLCEGDATSYGKVYYRTVSGGTWTALPGGPTVYNLNNAWTLQTVTNSAFDNQAFLEFGFQFNVGATGADPAFSVDEIKVTGTMSSTVAPVASFTSTPTPDSVCQGGCTSITSTSTISSGAIDSIRWIASVSGFNVLLATSTTLTFCATTPYNVPGTYTLKLAAYGNGKADTVSGTVTVKPSPYPLIKKAGKVLSLTSGSYSTYQWSNSAGNIAGATNATYTYSVAGTSYSVTVDSADGCSATSNLILTESVTNINEAENKYWFTPQGNSGIALHASDPLEEPLTITIYDATGRLVRSDKWNTGSDMKQVNDISTSPGLYIIRLSNANTSSVLKWMR